MMNCSKNFTFWERTDMNIASLWWERVPGASKYLEDAVEIITTYKILIVEEVPYIEHFLYLLGVQVRRQNTGLHIEEVLSQEWPEGQNPEEWLMDRYAVGYDYHPMQSSRLTFMAEKGLLENKMLIIRNGALRKEWMEVATGYAKVTVSSRGMIVLTHSAPLPSGNIRKGVKVLEWKRYLTRYDMQLFASYCIAAKSNLSLQEKNYIVELASKLAFANPELCPYLASENLAIDVIGTLKTLANNNEMAKKLILDPEFIQSVLWEAQIQIVFPIVESSRRSFIERYREKLKDVLPQADDFDQEITTPESMELRHLWYYYFKANGFENDMESERFWLLYEARNKLAHLKLVDYSTLIKIIKNVE